MPKFQHLNASEDVSGEHGSDNPGSKTEVGNNLLRAIKQSNLTKKVISEQSGVSPSQLRRYISGDSEATFSAMIRLSKTLNVSLNSLAYGALEEEKSQTSKEIIDQLKGVNNIKELCLKFFDEKTLKDATWAAVKYMEKRQAFIEPERLSSIIVDLYKKGLDLQAKPSHLNNQKDN